MNKTEIQFNVSNILKFINHISVVSNIVATIHHLSKTNEVDVFQPLDTDGLSIGFATEQGSIHANADDISGWIFQKAFEDFIVGLTQSLIEVYSLLKLHALSKRTALQPIISKQQLEDELKTIGVKGAKLNFPTIIEEIEKMLGQKLMFREEILSVNYVRNCFVHKGGIASTSFSLRYIEMRMIIKNNGELMRLTKELKKNKVAADQLFIQKVSARQTFEAGEKIIVSADVFKDVTYTCILFINELILKLPLPEEIKDQIIQPFTMQLVTSPNS